MTDALSQTVSSLRQSPLIRLIGIGALGVALGVPIIMIGALVGEREGRRDAAAAEVAGKWGGAQTVSGPALVVPYNVHLTETDSSGKTTTRTEVRRLVQLPSSLDVKGTMETTELARGIFALPVYTLSMTMTGEFKGLPLHDLGIQPGDVLWDRADLVVGVSEPKAIQSQVQVAWNGAPIAFLPGAVGYSDVSPGIHAPVAVDERTVTYRFSVPLVVRGSSGAYFTPTADETSVSMTSNFPDPNFQGAWLPAQRSVTPQGFSASWTIPSLGRDYPQTWIEPWPKMHEQVEKSRFGVEIAKPIDPYRMADRSVKYAVLFILATFGSLWLLEVMTGARVHPIQYLLLGAGLCLFFLLELSLSEHISFPLAYGIAAAAVIVMVTAYGSAILHSWRRALGVGAGVTTLYGFLYVLLVNEDFALLLGAIGLFLALAGIMRATRRVDWYATGATPLNRADPRS